MGRGSPLSVLVPVRFLLTLGHFIAVCMCFFSIDDNVDAETGSEENRGKAERTLEAALAVALICFVFDFVGMLGGFSLFFRGVALFQIASHFLGGLLVSWFISETWRAQTMWYIVGFCNMPSAAVEIGTLLALYVFRTIVT